MTDALDPRPIVAITRGDLFGDPVSRLGAVAEVRQRPLVPAPSEDELAELADGATAILGLAGDPIREELLARLPDLRLVALGSAGYDSVDVAAAARRGVIITNAPGVLSEAVADTTFGLILGARRRYVEADRYVRAGRWHEAGLELMVGPDIHGATLGLLGYGAIARAVARRAQGFGMTVVFHDPYGTADALARSVSLDELLATSDVLSIHVPLTPETRGLIGEAQLRVMKPDATLVNTSRGGVIDEPALVRALAEGWIGSAGLDVQAREPNPDAGSPLLALPNVVVLPHIGSASTSARLAMTSLAAENIEAVLAGRAPVTPVPGSPGYRGTA
jgi:lactate dehydrogenase-like 2-hydroxyacid dehydrogenase